MRPGALRAATAKAAARLGKMRTRLTAGEKPNRKRMATLVTVYDAEPARRRPHDVIAPPGGRHGARALRPGPKALAKWLAGSVRKDPAEVIAAAFDEAEARDPGHLRTWVVLVDGAEHQLDLIRAEAARRGATIHVVIDIIHVLEYLWKAAWSLHDAGDPAAEDWVAVKALAVLAGDSGRAAAEITAEADAAGLTGSQRAGADACVRYLSSKHEFLRYDQALASGLADRDRRHRGSMRHIVTVAHAPHHRPIGRDVGTANYPCLSGHRCNWILKEACSRPSILNNAALKLSLHRGGLTRLGGKARNADQAGVAAV